MLKDGFRWDYLENHTLINFQEYFVKNGVKANGGIKNSFSTVGFPQHIREQNLIENYISR